MLKNIFNFSSKKRGFIGAIVVIILFLIAFLFTIFTVMYNQGERAGRQTGSGGTVSCAGVNNITPEQYAWVQDASRIHLKGDEAALISLIQIESSWNPQAKNTQAAGLGQFLASTARGFSEFVGGDDKHGTNWPYGIVYDDTTHSDDARFDAKRSIYAAAHLLSGHIERYGSLEKAYIEGYHSYCRDLSEKKCQDQKAEAETGASRLMGYYNNLKNSGQCTVSGVSGSCGNAIANAEKYINKSIPYSNNNHCGPLNTFGPEGVVGLDCSGYTSRVYHDSNYLPSTDWCQSTFGIATSQNYTRVANTVDQAKSILQPGDVLLFGMGNDPSNPQHTDLSHAVLYGGKSGNADLVYESGGGGGGPHKSNYDVFGRNRDFYGVYRSKQCSSGNSGATAVNLNNKVITIDPGHPSEYSPGTWNSATGITEIKVVYEIALKTKAIMEQRGYKVVLTRSYVESGVRNNEVWHNGPKTSNQRRAEIANEANSGLLLRLHTDATGSRGFFVIYPDRVGHNETSKVSGPPESVLAPTKKAAEMISKNVKQKTGLPDLGMKNETGSPSAQDNGGVLIGSLYARVPAVTIEMIGMHASKANAEWINNPTNQQKMAEGLAAGAIEFLSSGN